MKTKLSWVAALVVASAVLAPPAVAQEGGGDGAPVFNTRVKVIEAPPPEDQGKDDTGEGDDGDGDGKTPTRPPPTIRALVDIDIPGLGTDDFELRDVADETIVMDAESVVTFNESDEPMALVILVQGNFRWMGNEQYTDPEDPNTGAIYPGAHSGMGPAIEALSKAGPEGSRAALLVYTAGKVLVKQAMGPARQLGPDALGPQAEYKDYISKPLVVGLTEAWKLLSKEEGARRILVVLGDGNDDNEDISGDLRKVINDLKNIEVEIYSIYYTSVAEESPQGRQNMKAIGYVRDYVATSRENFKTYADGIVEFIGARYYVDFPTPIQYEPDTEHEVSVVIKRDGEPLVSDPQVIKMPADYEPVKPEEPSRWWLWVLIAVAVLLLLLIVILLIKRARRPKQEYYEPEPMPMMNEPPPDPGHRHTVMLGVGGTAESMPVVGWVVPLNGPQQYQTFKLLQGNTKLGTGAGSHIIINDEFMTLEHCEIVSSPSGFVLNDLGSTNGTYLNRLRVSSHDLVDNDVIKLGKTELHFKSIN